MKKDRRDYDEAPELDSDVVVLLDEEGNESRFRILFDSLFVGERQYVVMMPADDEDALEPEMVILRVDTDENGEDILVTIDSDDEWVEVLKAFEEMDVEDALGDFEIDFDDEDDEEENPPRH
ncbi:MAG TPA: DUF1292 domain-containing protein [Firmicutes bacterium]|nr:DUF1292 domain-containing protein [Candidatus Fermentithermobacillaceae bacterium]